jgi:hypothetical protein
MLTYQLTHGASVIRSDGAIIPTNTANFDYQQYLHWVELGNAASAATPLTAAEQNAPILTQIAQLEAGQARAVREATLNVPGALDRLASLNSTISDLRKKLV